MNAPVTRDIDIDPREELDAAIKEVASAERGCAKAHAVIDLARIRLNAAEEMHRAAAAALEAAREAHAACLVDDAASSDKRPPSGDGLRKARLAVETASHDVAAARSASDVVRDAARTRGLALSRAHARRQKAVPWVTRVYEHLRPEDQSRLIEAMAGRFPDFDRMGFVR